MKLLKKKLTHFLLLLVAVAAIVLALPRNDRASFTYEEGQPWRYSLLTAPFDIPVYLDSTTYNYLTDSITRNFPPYVTYSDSAVRNTMDRLGHSAISPVKLAQLRRLVAQVYEKGVMPSSLRKRVRGTASRQVRIFTEDDDNMVNARDASAMLSVDEACKWVLDNYSSSFGEIDGLAQSDVEALRTALSPNILLDSLHDTKYLSQALQGVNAGQGKIRQGQRIVDRGEIVTPQIYTNLQTYEEMLSKNQEGDQTHTMVTIAGQFVYVLLAFVIFYLYLSLYRPAVFADTRYMAFMVSLITLFTLLAALLFENFSLGIYLTPVAAVPVMVLIFIDSRTAVISLLVTVMITALMATYQFQFVVTEIVVGLMAIFSLNQLSRRSQLLRTSLVIFLAYSVIGTVLSCVSGEVESIDWRMFMAYAINSLLFSLTYILIFVIEKIFGFTSAVTLVELSDINNPLLRRLAEEAPGTFQHSMQASTLAAEAARAIGANTQLVHTGALYHDIGKMHSPIFFTENQHGVNPHDGLDPQTSARKIIGHISDGVILAEKAKLPRVIQNFIREHHGKGITKYFYTVASNAAGHDVDKAPFSYPGPNPQSRETAIMMMADAVEAASRSLKEYTADSISNLVDKIIDSQIADGLLRESPVSFADVENIKATFKKRLGTIYHTRVAYPDRRQQVSSGHA